MAKPSSWPTAATTKEITSSLRKVVESVRKTVLTPVATVIPPITMTKIHTKKGGMAFFGSKTCQSFTNGYNKDKTTIPSMRNTTFIFCRNKRTNRTENVSDMIVFEIIDEEK